LACADCAPCSFANVVVAVDMTRVELDAERRIMAEIDSSSLRGSRPEHV